MTDDERREAKRLADQIIDEDSPPWNIKMAIMKGIEVGRESMRAEIGFLDLSKDDFKRVTDTLNQLLAERERSAKLVAWVKRAEDEGFRALRDYLRLENPEYSMFFDTVDVDPPDFANGWCCNLKHAIAEYEGASRCENEYRPWEELGQTEAEYYKARYIAARVQSKNLLSAIERALSELAAEQFAFAEEELRNAFNRL